MNYRKWNSSTDGKRFDGRNEQTWSKSINPANKNISKQVAIQTNPSLKMYPKI